MYKRSSAGGVLLGALLGGAGGGMYGYRHGAGETGMFGGPTDASRTRGAVLGGLGGALLGGGLAHLPSVWGTVAEEAAASGAAKGVEKSLADALADPNTTVKVDLSGGLKDFVNSQRVQDLLFSDILGKG